VDEAREAHRGLSEDEINARIRKGRDEMRRHHAEAASAEAGERVTIHGVEIVSTGDYQADLQKVKDIRFGKRDPD
jgi:hypothetical protein